MLNLDGRRRRAVRVAALPRLQLRDLGPGVATWGIHPAGAQPALVVCGHGSRPRLGGRRRDRGVVKKPDIPAISRAVPLFLRVTLGLKLSPETIRKYGNRLLNRRRFLPRRLRSRAIDT